MSMLGDRLRAIGQHDMAEVADRDEAGRTASVERVMSSWNDSRRMTDLDPESSDIIRAAVRTTMDRLHALERVDRIRVVAPRKGPDGILLARFNTNDPDHSEGQFALFAADPSGLHVVRPGYSLDDVERARPALGQPCDWQLTGCDDSPGVYRRAACDQYVVLFATCIGCLSNLNLIDDGDENGGST